MLTIAQTVAGALLTICVVPAQAVQTKFSQAPLGPTSHSSDAILHDISIAYNVTLHSPIGTSNCKPGKKCIGIVLLAGLVEHSEDDGWLGYVDPNAYSCPEFGKGTTERVCNFLCGAFANIAHHEKLFKEIDSDLYSFDLILMHDSSLPERSLEIVRALGARTLLFDDEMKRRSCEAFVSKNDVSTFTHSKELPMSPSICAEAPFDRFHFTDGNLLMFIQQLKLGALGLFDYHAVAHLDIDMFITNQSSILEEIHYFFANDIALMAAMGKLSPLNAGHWVAKPSPDTFKLWLDALIVNGFNTTDGWGNASMVVPDFETALHRNRPTVPTKDWDFVGADRDQGLLYYVFAIKLHGWYAEAPVEVHKITLGKRDLHYAEESQVRFTGLDFPMFDEQGIVHMCGVGKPWDRYVCLQGGVDDKRKQVLRNVLPHIVSGMDALHTNFNSAFINEYCYPRLADNADQCASSTSNDAGSTTGAHSWFGGLR